MNIINGVKIETNVTISNESYGLYATTGLSEFRFSECAVTGLPETWKDGFITRRGIVKGSRKFDLLETGNSMQSTDITIRLLNTSQLIFFLEANSISLYKCILSVYEFVGTDSDADSIAYRKEVSRTVEDIKFTDTEIILKCKANLAISRNKVLSAPLDDITYLYVPETNKDKRIPMIFGSSDPLNGRYFKILQSVNKYIKYYSEDWFDTEEHATTYCLSPGAYEFPQISTETLSNAAYILGGEASTGYTSYLQQASFFNGKYLKCIEGKSNNSNVIRKILSSSISNYILDVTFQDYMEDIAVGNTNYNATDQTYFELYDIDVKYILSLYAILGFYLSSDGITESQSQPELYANINNETVSVMSSSVDINIASNIITLNPRIYRGDKLTTLYNFSFFSPEDYGPMDYDEYVRQNGTGIQVQAPGGGYVPGLFTTIPGSVANNNAVQTGIDNIVDKDYNTYYRWFCENYTGDIIFAFMANPQKLPDTFKFAKCYLGIKANCGISGINFRVMYKKYMHVLNTPYDKTSSGASGLDVDNMPDFYYETNAPSTGNKNFFFNYEDSDKINGYTKIDLDISTYEEFNSIKGVGIYFYKIPGVTNTDVTIDITEIAFIFENEQNIENEFYV